MNCLSSSLSLRDGGVVGVVAMLVTKNGRNLAGPAKPLPLRRSFVPNGEKRQVKKAAACEFSVSHGIARQYQIVDHATITIRSSIDSRDSVIGAKGLGTTSSSPFSFIGLSICVEKASTSSRVLTTLRPRSWLLLKSHTSSLEDVGS